VVPVHPPDIREGPAAETGPTQKNSVNAKLGSSVTLQGRILRYALADRAEAEKVLRNHGQQCVQCMNAKIHRRGAAGMCKEGLALGATITELDAVIKDERRLAEQPLPGQLAFDFCSDVPGAVIER